MDRLERLADLAAVLLDTRRLLTADEILEAVPGYPDAPASARRQFERDKEVLREAGIPLLSAPVDELGGTDFGYRIPPEEYYLQDLGLTPDEQAALHVAVTAVRFEAGDALEGLFKLGGLEGTGSAPLAALPSLPALHGLFEAYQRRATVQFTYRDEHRRVDPWGILFRRGRWYLVGLDHDRAQPRTFRIDRVEGPVNVGAPGAFTPPSDVDPAEVAGDEPWTFGTDEPVTARVLVDASVASALTGEAVLETRADGSVVVELEVTNREAFRSLVVGFLERAEILEPQELREDLLTWLAQLAGSDGSREESS